MNNGSVAAGAANAGAMGERPFASRILDAQKFSAFPLGESALRPARLAIDEEGPGAAAVGLG
jgi:hypothetical protein